MGVQGGREGENGERDVRREGENGGWWYGVESMLRVGEKSRGSWGGVGRECMRGGGVE